MSSSLIPVRRRRGVKRNKSQVLCRTIISEILVLINWPLRASKMADGLTKSMTGSVRHSKCMARTGTKFRLSSELDRVHKSALMPKNSSVRSLVGAVNRDLKNSSVSLKCLLSASLQADLWALCLCQQKARLRLLSLLHVLLWEVASMANHTSYTHQKP
jgi:hypothetical protein